jgi:hypothetical protein
LSGLTLPRSSMVATYITERDLDMDAGSVAPKHRNQRLHSSREIDLALPRHPFVVAGPSGTAAPCTYSTCISPSILVACLLVVLSIRTLLEP